MRHVLAFLAFTASMWASAEPGYLKPGPSPLPNPRSSPPVPARIEPKPTGPLLEDKFSHSRGLKDYEVQTLHYNRVSCVRRLFSQSGLSLEGDADLKATNVGSDLAEIEFPAYVHFSQFNSVNPFSNGVLSIETMNGRRLVKTHPWSGQRPLLLTKKVTVRFEQEGRAPALVDSIAEVRVSEESYPSTFIIKETVMLPKKFSIYFICQ